MNVVVWNFCSTKCDVPAILSKLRVSFTVPVLINTSGANLMFFQQILLALDLSSRGQTSNYNSLLSYTTFNEMQLAWDTRPTTHRTSQVDTRQSTLNSAGE